MSTDRNKQPKIVGVFELVRFPEFDNKQAIAKLDTGAFTGALHCSSINEISTEKGRLLEFTPLDSTKPVKVEEFAIAWVKSSNGIRTKRYFIDTKIVIGGKEYEIVFSLTDRSDMKWQVLIGRRFLSSAGFVIDARQPSKYRKARGSKP